MNTAAYAGGYSFRVSRYLFVIGLLAAIGAWTVFGATDGGTNAAYLGYTVASQPLRLFGLTLTPEPKAFQKEPDTGGRRVCRASFYYADRSAEATAFLWDYTKGKLYLDLNHNRDLTDDPEGVLTCPVSRFNYYYQSFTNAQLQVKTARGICPVCLDLNLYGPEGNRLSGSAAWRSYWEGKISLRGHDYQVGRVDEPAKLGLDNEGFLLLRPWERRQEPWDLMNGSLDAVGYSQNVFFNGQAYRVDCSWIPQDEKPGFKLTFREREVELGELKLTGQFVERLVLTGARPGRSTNSKQPVETPTVFTVLLDRPESVVKIPIGEYQQGRVSVKSGGVSAHNDVGYGNSQAAIKIVANPTEVPVLAVGGPLTNNVLVQPRGRELSLNYRLLGGGGESYQLIPVNRDRPPRFVVYKGEKPIHSGRFEFG
jgi:hypothetical protein